MIREEGLCSIGALNKNSSKTNEVEAGHCFGKVVMDATHGSEVGKAMAYYVLDALLGLDHQQVFLSQLQSRGLLQLCLTDISTNSYQVRVCFPTTKRAKSRSQLSAMLIY